MWFFQNLLCKNHSFYIFIKIENKLGKFMQYYDLDSVNTLKAFSQYIESMKLDEGKGIGRKFVHYGQLATDTQGAASSEFSMRDVVEKFKKLATKELKKSHTETEVEQLHTTLAGIAKQISDKDSATLRERPTKDMPWYSRVARAAEKALGPTKGLGKVQAEYLTQLLDKTTNQELKKQIAQDPALPDSVRLKYFETMTANDLAVNLFSLKEKQPAVFLRIVPKMNAKKLQDVLDVCMPNPPPEEEHQDLNVCFAVELAGCCCNSKNSKTKNKGDLLLIKIRDYLSQHTDIIVARLNTLANVHQTYRTSKDQALLLENLTKGIDAIIEKLEKKTLESLPKKDIDSEIQIRMGLTPDPDPVLEMLETDDI
jgi:hypothetical protein